MPHKHNADRRHHIPKMAFKVRNWPEYEAGLRRRGSLTLWIEDAALDHWQTFGPGGQARYKDAAIQTTLMVRTAFRLALRQTEGLMASVITLMDLKRRRNINRDFGVNLIPRAGGLATGCGFFRCLDSAETRRNG